MLRMRDLTAVDLALLRFRLSPFFPLVITPDAPPGFHFEHVVFRRGELLCRPESPVHGVLHDAAHALFLPAAERAAWEQDHIPTGAAHGGYEADDLLALQVLLSEGFESYDGLAAMEEAGYFGDGCPDGDWTYEWWEDVGRDATPAPPWEDPVAWNILAEALYGG